MRIPVALQQASANWFSPRLAPLLEKRSWGWWISAVGCLHLGLTAAGGGIGCVIHDLTGVTCPGCGLTTAVELAWRGDWRASFESHAFLPVFLAAFATVVATSVGPERWRRRVICLVRRSEERTGITALLACALLSYWAVRLLDP